jgi:hypothetical protein
VQTPLIRQSGLPYPVTVCFVRVRLNTASGRCGVTSLRDEVAYPTVGFLALYQRRWGAEAFYGVLKTRLYLENFSGLGTEAIRQDFHATVDLTGLESIWTEAAQTHLDAKETRHPQTVNLGALLQRH